MISISARALLGVVGAGTLLIAGCGTNEVDDAATAGDRTTVATAPATTIAGSTAETVSCPPAPTSMMGEGTRAVSGADAPTVSLDVKPDAKAGYNVAMETTNFTWAPEHASGEHVDGEGHAHLYVDGKKVGRVYEPWVHLMLEPGDHEVTVSLNGNDHAAYVVDGVPVEATAEVEVGAVMEGPMMQEGVVETAKGSEVTVTLTAEADAKAGCNFIMETTGFMWAPEHASGEPVAGEGHAHVYVDGEKQGRLYGPAFHLVLEPGTHEVRVSLNGNDHSGYAVDGQAVEASVTVEVEA
jgi:hypothetical protein